MNETKIIEKENRDINLRYPIFSIKMSEVEYI